MQGGTKTFQKNANLSIVLHALRWYGRLSRIELARILGLNRSTITHIVSSLLERGIVRVDSEGEPSNLGGRKPVYLRINGAFGAVVGLEMQYTLCRAVLFALDGRELCRRSIRFEDAEQDGDRGFADRCIRALREMARIAEDRGHPLLGAGVGVPGVVDPFRGRIVRSRTLHLADFDFARRIDSAVSFPVLVENDANCCALRELEKQMGRGPENFLYLLPKFNTETSPLKGERVVGIGMGIVIGNEIYHGNSFAAGEFRSVFWKQGNHEQINLKSGYLLKIEEDRHILRRFFREVALNLSPIISVLNPGRIYIGGDAGEYYDVMIDVIQSELNERYIGLEERGCELVPADYDKCDVAYGGGALVFEKLFRLPDLRKIDIYYSLDWESVLQNAGAGSAEADRAAERHDSVVL